MEREYRELPGGLAEMAHIAQSDREIQQLSRVYEVPKTHELAVRVEGMKFIVYPRLKQEYRPDPGIDFSAGALSDAQAATLAVAAPKLDSLTQTPPEEPATVPGVEIPMAGPAPHGIVETVRGTASTHVQSTPAVVLTELAELNKKSHPELLTLAAELEVDGINKNMSKAKIIAAIIEKRHPTAKD